MPRRPYSNESERPVRDQHGHHLPDQPGSRALSPDQIDQGLAALPGWKRRGRALLRTVPVARDSREALREGVRTVISDADRLRLEDGTDNLTIALQGEPELTAADLETAARIDTVLSGSGTDRGST
jgi:hypothetical protein